MIAELAAERAVDAARAGNGAKCDRLLAVAAIEELAELVPPIVLVPPLDEPDAARGLPPDDRRRAYADALSAARPGLLVELHRRCGPPPWIVRSSGDEDGEEDANAGGYDSLICADEDQLAETVAAVALSGSGELSLRQRALGGGAGSDPIPCFVQPLLPVDTAAGVEPEDAPYLDDDALAAIEHVARQLIAMFDLAAIDCEWGVETDQGFVSITTLMPRDPATATGLHALGFGFGAAQTVDGRPTSTGLSPAGTTERLWRGRSLRRCVMHRLRLLQVRPARLEPAFAEAACLVPAAAQRLAAQHDALPAVPLIAGRATHGRFLAAPTLMGAWRDYLLLDARERAGLDLVVVAEGSAGEHAAIMFRQEGIGCLALDLLQLPQGASRAMFDGTRCFFGDEDLVGPGDLETRRLLVLPPDCFRVARAGDTAASITATLDAIPASPRVREAVIRRSLVAHEDGWIADGPYVRSASLDGVHAVAVTVADRSADDFALLYRAAEALHGGAPVHDVLPRLARLAAADATYLARCPDLRVPIALLRCERMGWADAGDLAALLRTAATALRSERVRDARLVLEAAARLADDTALLPIYDDADKRDLLRTMAAAVATVADPADLAALATLRLPATAHVVLLSAAAQDATLRTAAIAFADARARFRGGGFIAEAAECAAHLCSAYAAFRTELARAGIAELDALAAGSLIEDYDAALKALLSRLAADPDPVLWRRYLGVMRVWIAFGRLAFAAADHGEALRRLDERLGAWADRPPLDDYAIGDRAWRVEFRALAAGTAEPYENPHVVHNLLHQWMLAANAVSPALLPPRLRALHRFNASFSTRATSVLRFERDLVEISVPMGTHKAAFSFRPHLATVEWSEPPDCDDDEIARLLAFGTVLDRFARWWPGSLQHRREKAAGTWTLFIRCPAPAEGWRTDDLFRICAQLRLLFDGAYDFSYVPNAAVDGLAGAFSAEPWRDVFERLIRHRLVLDDGVQYVALHTQPLSSWLATAAQSAAARGAVARVARADFAAATALVERFSRAVSGEAADLGRFARRYALLRLLCLVVAAYWPLEAVRFLADRTDYGIGHDLIAASVLRRQDVREEVAALAARGALPLAGFRGLVVRHAPALLIGADDAGAYAAALLEHGHDFRRARQYLLAHHAAALGADAAAALVRGLGTVPFGMGDGNERVIADALERVGSRLRFDLARGVDWTELSDEPGAADG